MDLTGLCLEAVNAWRNGRRRRTGRIFPGPEKNRVEEGHDQLLFCRQKKRIEPNEEARQLLTDDFQILTLQRRLAEA